ncbi:PD-(D/E)XK nuclease family protein [Candidatus Sumerlaeota bacterium]|nr:PD-(D/E)XK nuclease family protein [Candidatus Sumerlaeota bacterium]
MSVRFLIGPSGAGKTHRCCGEIAAACAGDPLGAPIIYLVPEQGSYEAERTLLESGLRGYTRAQVLSFTRLAEFVFAQVPAPQRARLSRVHRDVLAKLLVTKAKADGRGALEAAEGLEEALASFISETRQQAISIEDLRKAASAVERHSTREDQYPPALLAEKLNNLARLLEEYEAIVASRFEDPQDTLRSLAELVVKTELLQGAHLYVDGFITFSPVEEQLLVALARKCERTTITMLGERANLDEPEPRAAVFSAVRKCSERLWRILGENGVGPITAEMITSRGASRFSTDALGFLEQKFLSPEPVESASHQGIEMWSAETPLDEARLAAELASRAMVENGLAPGDIAILARDLEMYAEPLQDMLMTLKVPVFIDRAEPLENHPLITGVQALVRCALYPSQVESRIALAKSGLLPLERRHVDRLENHILQYPKSQRDWHADEPWKPPPSRVAPDDDEKRDMTPVPLPPVIDATRRAILRVIRSFTDRLYVESRTHGPLRHFVFALCQTVDEVIRGRGLDEQEEKILARMGELFMAAAEAAGDEEVEWSVAGDLTLASLRQMSLPRIPPMLDQLFVGQVDRSRYPRLKLVIVAGLSEGIFPRVGTNRTLLNDSERDLMEEMGFNVQPGARRQFDREGLFAYRAVTAASQRLILLRSRTDGSGEMQAVSPYWRDIAKRFPSIIVREADAFDAATRAWRPRELESSILRNVDETHRFVKEPSGTDGRIIHRQLQECEAVRSAATNRNRASLPATTLAAFMNHRLLASASRLESFGRCPFQHYVRSLLRPNELVAPNFQRTDAGIYAHAVLRNATRLLRERKWLGREVTPEQLEEVYQRAKEKPFTHLQQTGILANESEKLVFENVDQFVRDLVKWLGDAFQQVPYAPIAEEISLTEGQAVGLCAYKPASPGDGWAYEIRGQIDRLDENRALPGEYAIVDYKLGEMSFDFQAWNGGDNLQLPIYLLAVRDAREGNRVAGALYLNIVPRNTDEKPDEKSHKYQGIFRSSALRRFHEKPEWNKMTPIQGAAGDPEVKPRGWGTAISDSEFDALLDRTVHKVEEAGRAIVSGEASVSPSRYGTETACSRCSYQPICMVDFLINPARVKEWVRRETVLELLNKAS